MGKETERRCGSEQHYPPAAPVETGSGAFQQAEKTMHGESPAGVDNPPTLAAIRTVS